MIKYVVSKKIISNPNTPIWHLERLNRMLKDYIRKEKVDEKTPCPTIIVLEVEKSERYVELIEKTLNERNHGTEN